jgi:hypothetical protein
MKTNGLEFSYLVYVAGQRITKALTVVNGVLTLYDFSAV